MLAAVLASTAGLGERRSRGYYLDSLGTVALIEEDLNAAAGYIAEAADLATAIGDANLLAEIGMHRALVQLAAGDLDAPAGWPSIRSAAAHRSCCRAWRSPPGSPATP
jgi:hypothetical protein